MLKTLTMATALALLPVIGLAQSAPERRPLLMAGKSTLEQRVLTRPGAVPVARPGDDAPEGAAVIPPLSLLFVYGRETAGGEDWVEVGRGGRSAPVGWVPARTVIDWKQNLVVAFTDRVNRNRALFFKDGEDLRRIVEEEDAGAFARDTLTAIQTGTLAPDAPVIAAEPPAHVDISRQFYLLPILDWQEVWFPDGFQALALNVAATSEGAEAPETAAEAAPEPDVVAEGYRTGVVFVVDTSISFDRYIRAAERVMTGVRDRLVKEFGPAAPRFGLVGFRDVMEDGSPDGYVSKVFAEPVADPEQADFLTALGRLEASQVSNRDFREDAYAGLRTAIEGVNWGDTEGRFVVLITDASPRTGAEDGGASGLGTEQLRLLAQANRTAIAAVHLETPAGAEDHARAAAAYRDLTDYPNIGSLYFPVAGGDVAAYEAVVDRLATTIAQGMRPDLTPADVPEVEAAPAPAPVAEALERTGLVGKAMRLAWAGAQQGSRPPELFQAWVADRDLANPASKALDVRVLITRNQLSDLQATLQAILDAGEATRIAPGDFFGALQGAAAAMSRRPDRVAGAEARRLADTGLIGEYLEGLPYRSRVLELTEDDWLAWSFGQQREFLDDLAAKIRLYRAIHDDADLWIALDDDRAGGEAVYPIALDALP
ncbi:VWA domain-containing protein (plasmid) [Tistrella mobilis]|uniref:vWA domain-containing protein n=1 Tax=Tistrella mobilis TaxID=171437 RepID=UPI003557EA47